MSIGGFSGRRAASNVGGGGPIDAYTLLQVFSDNADEDTTILDTSGHGNIFTAQGTYAHSTDTAPATENSSLLAVEDASDSNYARSDNNLSIWNNGMSSWYLGLDLYMNNIESNYNQVFGFGGDETGWGGSDGQLIGIAVRDNLIDMAVHNGSSLRTVSFALSSAAQAWHRFEWRCNAGTLKVYQDSVQKGSNETTCNIGTVTNMHSVCISQYSGEAPVGNKINDHYITNIEFRDGIHTPISED